MKKILSILATIGVVASSAFSAVACGTNSESKSKNDLDQPKENLNEIIKNFQVEVTKIYIDHMKIEVNQNLIAVQENEKKHLFIKKENIKSFSNREKELTLKNKKEIEYDENLILKSSLLAEKLNELKKINKYKIILNDINSIFDGIEIIYNDNFKIKFGELSQGVYIGNFINEYKINIKYKGKNDIEKYEIKDTLKYTSTDSQSLKISGDSLVKNIEKDFLVSNEMKKYSNFEWSNIKGNKQTYEGYGEFSNQIKNYINSSDEYKNNLIDFIKQKYFISFKNLSFEFNKNVIYIDSSFKTNLFNVFENKIADSFENFVDSEQNSEKIFKSIFRNNDNDQTSINILKDLYFTKSNMEKWNKDLIDLKNNYLKNLKLTEQQNNLVQESVEYISADSIGNIKIKGINIVIGSKENKYIHELSDFNLSVTYNVSSKVEEKIDFLSQFTSKTLIKGLYDFYGIDSSFKYPDFNSNEDYLMNITNKKIILRIKEHIKKYQSDSWQLSVLFWAIWVSLGNQFDNELISKLKISNFRNESSRKTFFIFPNYSKSLIKYANAGSGIFKNNKIDYVLNENDISFVHAKTGAKDKNPDLITFKLGYLAVNLKYEKLFKLSEDQQSKIFIKFM